MRGNACLGLRVDACPRPVGFEARVWAGWGWFAQGWLGWLASRSPHPPSQGAAVSTHPHRGLQSAPTPHRGLQSAPTPHRGLQSAPTPHRGLQSAPTPHRGLQSAPTPHRGLQSASTPHRGLQSAPSPAVCLAQSAWNAQSLCTAHSPNKNILFLKFECGGRSLSYFSTRVGYGPRCR